ncbi:energy-coupling factor transporter transmembrane protein EcfT [Bifidobacterium sp. 64T4]|uniref:energy-coupling factor transporter transmembrane component T family protein n=1 Tax=Bifidobacterium pongonis TaxID=2834432 RepID=UPI001C58062B|nr:energy-coupling factor transporter transmembrane component T [Bifidobacterium pongonis]MBW3094564.1 energy-coupling factor transporter transmembrane protein EcfT [Bifidobacterium pongonis]
MNETVNIATRGTAAIETIGVVPHKDRLDEPRAASPSWFIAKINPVSRFVGALILCIPMFFTLDIVSASVAFGLELALLWIGGIAPWTVLRRTWPVWIAATGSFVSVALYGKTSGTVLANLGGLMVISQGSLYLAFATFIRVTAIAVPGVILALGLDPTDLADGLVQILHLPSKFVYGGLAGMRMFTLLQDDWRALGQSRRSRGLGDGNVIKRVFAQAFNLLVVSIRRGTKLATAMEARGFGTDTPRGQARESKLHAVDWLFYLICILVPVIALTTAYCTGYWHWAFSSISN